MGGILEPCCRILPIPRPGTVSAVPNVGVVARWMSSAGGGDDGLGGGLSRCEERDEAGLRFSGMKDGGGMLFGGGGIFGGGGSIIVGGRVLSTVGDIEGPIDCVCWRWPNSEADNAESIDFLLSTSPGRDGEEKRIGRAPMVA